MSSTCQSDHLGRLLGQCEHRMRMVMDRSLRQYGVTPVQCRALMYLHRQPEPVTQRQLEQYMAVKPSTINGIVGRLEEKGLLTRDACQQDARCRVLRLTEEGRRFRSDFIRIAQKANRQMEQGFSPEELAHVGEGVGSDVPYCVLGGTALAQNLATQMEETEL